MSQVDYEKWHKVFYNEKGRKDNYICPKIINKDNEYFSSILCFLNNLLHDLKHENIEEDYIKIAEEYKGKFEDILYSYYSGNIINAYKIVEEMVIEFKKSTILVSKLSKSYSFNYYIIENKKWNEFIFYRAR